jgi:AAA15 family ATPase/GTPase
MITEISISNYKSVLKESFMPGNVNVFVGKEGSGKTNILEAIGMAAAAHDDALSIDALQKRGINILVSCAIFHRNEVVQDERKTTILWFEKNSRKKAILVKNEHQNEGAALWKDISWFEPDYIDKINDLIRFIGDGSIEEKYPFADDSKNKTMNSAFRASRNFRDFILYDNKIKDLELLMKAKTPPIFAVDNIDTVEAYNIVVETAIKQGKQVFISISDSNIAAELDLKNPNNKLFLVKMTDGQTHVEDITDIKQLEL